MNCFGEGSLLILQPVRQPAPAGKHEDCSPGGRWRSLCERWPEAESQQDQRQADAE